MDHEQQEPSVYHVGCVAIDITTETVQYQNQEVALTYTEWNILRCFVQHHNHVLTPYDIMAYLNITMSEDAIRWYIMQIRKKIEINPTRPQIIRTLHGRGYRFVIPDHAVRT